MAMRCSCPVCFTARRKAAGVGWKERDFAITLPLDFCSRAVDVPGGDQSINFARNLELAASMMVTTTRRRSRAVAARSYWKLFM